MRRTILRRLPALLLLGLAACMARADVVPADLEARRTELAALEAEVKSTKALVGPRVNAVLPHVADFVRDLRGLHKIPLSEAERRAMIEQGAAGLSPEKAARFQAAAPSFEAMKSRLAEYFAAYDSYQNAEIHHRTYGAILGALERREALAPLMKAKHLRKLDAAFEALAAKEREYRELVADPDHKFYDRPELAKEVYFLAVDADELLLKYERKYGLEPKLPWGHKVGNFFRGLKQKARALKIQMVSLPAMARLFTHVFLRPYLTSKHDPDKTNDLIRFFSRSYRWAAGMELNVTGQEGIPTDAPVVFALSHRATIEDAMTMTAVVPGKYSFMWGARAIPGWLQKKLVEDPTVIAVGGTKPDGSQVDAIQESVEAIHDGQNLALFPEGNVPTPQGETRPLRSGLDVITAQVSEKPVYIVPITIADTALDWDSEHLEPSKAEKLEVDVTIGAPIDPLVLKTVPGADGAFLLDVVRAIYHRNLYRPDVPLDPPECPSSCRVAPLGVIPAPAEANSQAAFQTLHHP